jgi:aspartyl-tRNA(Asn)/glutamyl-tRNA(Gln) amidotransferase subunit A
MGDLTEFWAALGQGRVRAWRPRRLAVLSAGLENMDDEVGAVFSTAVDRLAASGCAVREVRSGSVAEWQSVSTTILFHEAYRAHRGLLERSGPSLGADVRERLERGGAIGVRGYRAAIRRRDRLAEEAMRVLGDVDAVLSPTLPILPPLVDGTPGGRARAELTQNTRLFNLLGAPAISVPAAGPSVPVGLQLAAAPGRDAKLLACAAAVERILA